MATVTTDLFADIDRMDAHAFASYLSEAAGRTRARGATCATSKYASTAARN
jgi:hypothetical protein